MIEPERKVVVIGSELFALGLVATLRGHGYSVSVITGARRGAEMLATISWPPAALLVDLMVARHDDFALLRWIQSRPTLAAVPVLVSSPGTVVGDVGLLERQLHLLGARPLLDPHDLGAILDELVCLPPHVA